MMLKLSEGPDTTNVVESGNVRTVDIVPVTMNMSVELTPPGSVMLQSNSPF